MDKDIEAMTRIFDLQRISYRVEASEKPGVKKSIILEAGTKGVEGYAGFQTTFNFDSTGCLVEVEIYE